jgi:hypothetical protein
MPVHPGSPGQLTITQALATLTARWKDVLSPAEREGWGVYALNTLRTDSLGNPITLTGLNWYVACNVPRIQIGQAVIDAPPTTFGMASVTTPSIISLTAATDLYSVAFTNTDEWANEVGGFLVWAGARPVSQSVNFFKGPFQFTSTIIGAVAPPASPDSVASPFAIAVGQKGHIQGRVLRADGRISAPFILSAIAI